METCPVCERGTLESAKIHEERFGVDLGTYAGERCSTCGETFLDAKAVREIERRSKAAGLWGAARDLTVEEEGDFLVVRIPSDLAKLLKMSRGAHLHAHLEGSRIVVDSEGSS